MRLPVAALFLPFVSNYRPLPVALGVLAAELMVLVYASFSLRKRIGLKNWRRLHWATYAIFAGATLHGLAAGTDTTRPWAIALYLAAIGSVAAATARRALVRLPSPARSATMSYRVAIDTSLGCGCGGCVRVAPDTFVLENGLAVLRALETSDGTVVEAADACPVGAITVEEAPCLAA